jgi:glutamate 5-kinase
MSKWHEAFGVRNVEVAQILVGRDDFDSRERFLNIRNCLACLHDHAVIPIVNENDSVATEEISLGDNDILAAKLASAMRADLLVILTTVGGVETASRQILERAEDAERLAHHVRAETSGQGRGGMRTKIEAARIASSSGTPTLIAPGRPIAQLTPMLEGRPIGTLVLARQARHAGRRLWIAMAATPNGRIEVDDGAARAIAERGASLLAKGITGVVGRFGVGDVVSIMDPRGHEIARGLTNLTSDELALVKGCASSEFETILGRRAHEEVIHRDNLAMITE